MNLVATASTESPDDSPARTVIVFIISNLEYGGAQRQLIELANNFDHQLYDVHICSLSKYCPLAADLDTSQITLHIIEKRVKFDLGVVLKFAKLLRVLRASIVQSYLFDAEIAARLATTIVRTPLMVCSERNTDYRLRRAQSIAHLATKTLYEACIANSRAGALFNAKLYGLPREKYYVIRNGVDTNKFRPLASDAIRQTIGLSREAFCVGMFGSFKEQKNHPLLLKAAELVLETHPNTCFLFVGDELHRGLHGSTEYKENIQQLISDLNIKDNCMFLGNRDDVSSLYCACDVTVLPSLFEGTPNVVLESLACSVPVIATDVSDNREIIPDGKVGYIVELGDVSALADRISHLCHNPQELARMKIAAREWAIDKFSTEQLARNTENVYQELLSKIV